MIYRRHGFFFIHGTIPLHEFRSIFYYIYTVYCLRDSVFFFLIVFNLIIQPIVQQYYSNKLNIDTFSINVLLTLLFIFHIIIEITTFINYMYRVCIFRVQGSFSRSFEIKISFDSIFVLVGILKKINFVIQLNIFINEKIKIKLL